MKFIKGNNGSAIVTILLLFVALVGYTLYYIGSARIKADIKKRSQNDANVLAATASIRSILSTPANCNATFKGTAGGTSGVLTEIRRCSSGENCYTGPNGFGFGTETAVIRVTSGSNWNTATTGLPANIRLIDIRYDRILPYQTMDRPGTVRFELTFEKMLRPGTTSIVKAYLDQLVVFDVPTKSTIVGCPKAPQTIDAYGDKACHKPWNFDEVVLHNASTPAYRLPHVVGCSFPGNIETRYCSDNELDGNFMYGSCINDGGWSASPTSYGTCNCIGAGVGWRTVTYSCNNPAPDPGGLPCPAPPATTGSCSMSLIACP